MARDWLRQLRTEKGLSRTEFARKLGISRQDYYLSERGARMGILDLDVAEKISKVLKISISAICKHERAMKE